MTMPLKGLPGIEIPERSPFSTHVFHQYTLRLDGIDREALMKHLEAKGIPSMIYYPVPLPCSTGFPLPGLSRR